MNPPQIKRTVAERPILFSAEMVRAILDGTKTQTRRVVKVEHAGCGQHVHPAVTAITHREDGWFGFDSTEKLKEQYITTFPFYTIRCPYGVPGDRLWVRETFQRSDLCAKHEILDRNNVWYLATDEKPLHIHGWRPSIFMPRWASRITLEVVSVRVERVQEISAADARAEGIRQPKDWETWSDQHGILEYRNLWNSINAKRGFGWDKNPWVWVIEFRRVEP